MLRKIDINCCDGKGGGGDVFFSLANSELKFFSHGVAHHGCNDEMMKYSGCGACDAIKIGRIFSQ